MKRILFLVALVLAPRAALAFGGISDPGVAADSQPGASWSRIDLSYVRFTSYYDADGHRRSLDRAYATAAGNGRGVAIDALVVSFAGRFVIGPGCSAGVNVPLVRNSRSGHIQVVPGIEQSVYAEGSSIGDIVADVTLEVPLPDTRDAFGASFALQAPSGTWHGLDATRLPTGNGTIGAGGELFAGWRSEVWEAGAAAGILVLLPRRQSGGDVDLGDPIWGRAHGSRHFGQNASAGLEVTGINRTADRVARTPVADATLGDTPGMLSPASSLVTVSPFVEGRVARSTFARVSISNPANGWMFIPVRTGVAVRGRNVLAPDAQLALSVQARF